jgi:hypothetical protein
MNHREQIKNDDSQKTHVFDLNRKRNSLARALEPSYYGLDPSDYSDIKDEMRIAASPNQLVKSLVDVPGGSPAAVSYMPGGSNRFGYIALTPDEYSLIIRNVDSFSKAIHNTTLAARPIGDAHTDAANSSVDQALEIKQKSIEAYIQETLIPWNKLIGSFAVAAQNPGLSLMGSELSMRLKLETFKTTIVGNMLDALKVQRGWSEDQYHLAEKTIEARIFIDRENNQHIKYFAGMVALSRYYIGHKTVLFNDRMYQIKKITNHSNND